MILFIALILAIVIIAIAKIAKPRTYEEFLQEHDDFTGKHLADPNALFDSKAANARRFRSLERRRKRTYE